jgi:hypothetical protein
MHATIRMPPGAPISSAVNKAQHRGRIMRGVLAGWAAMPEASALRKSTLSRDASRVPFFCRKISDPASV